MMRVRQMAAFTCKGQLLTTGVYLGRPGSVEPELVLVRTEPGPDRTAVYSRTRDGWIELEIMPGADLIYLMRKTSRAVSRLMIDSDRLRMN